MTGESSKYESMEAITEQAGTFARQQMDGDVEASRARRAPPRDTTQPTRRASRWMQGTGRRARRADRSVAVCGSKPQLRIVRDMRFHVGTRELRAHSLARSSS